jgi:beta-glucosidase
VGGRSRWSTLPLAVAALSSAAPAAAVGRCGSHRWCNTALSPVQRADLVLAQMTTGEKVAMLGGVDFAGGAVSSPTSHTGIEMGVPRLGVPTLYYTDGPLGPRQGDSTGMPAPLGLAATFNPAMARLYGSVSATRHATRATTRCTARRSTSCERRSAAGPTRYGEDPFLVAQTATAWVEGLQSQGELATLKHFAENNQEGEDPTGLLNRPGTPVGVGLLGDRMLENSVVDDRTLHEIRLYGFQQTIAHA